MIIKEIAKMCTFEVLVIFNKTKLSISAFRTNIQHSCIECTRILEKVCSTPLLQNTQLYGQNNWSSDIHSLEANNYGVIHTHEVNHFHAILKHNCIIGGSKYACQLNKIV